MSCGSNHVPYRRNFRIERFEQTFSLRELRIGLQGPPACRGQGSRGRHRAYLHGGGGEVLQGAREGAAVVGLGRPIRMGLGNWGEENKPGSGGEVARREGGVEEVPSRRRGGAPEQPSRRPGAGGVRRVSRPPGRRAQGASVLPREQGDGRAVAFVGR